MRTYVGLVAVVVVLWWSPALAEKAAAPPRVELPVIEILDPSGVITAPFVRAAIGKVEPALLACAAPERWKSDALVWIVTDWRGKVTKLELAVDSAGVEKCFTKVLKTVVVTKTQVRATTFLRLRIATAGDDPVE